MSAAVAYNALGLERFYNFFRNKLARNWVSLSSGWIGICVAGLFSLEMTLQSDSSTSGRNSFCRLTVEMFVVAVLMPLTCATSEEGTCHHPAGCVPPCQPSCPFLFESLRCLHSRHHISHRLVNNTTRWRSLQNNWFPQQKISDFF